MKCSQDHVFLREEKTLTLDFGKLWIYGYISRVNTSPAHLLSSHPLTEGENVEILHSLRLHIYFLYSLPPGVILQLHSIHTHCAFLIPQMLINYFTLD